MRACVRALFLFFCLFVVVLEVVFVFVCWLFFGGCWLFFVCFFGVFEGVGCSVFVVCLFVFAVLFVC